MALSQLNFGGLNMVEAAIARIKEFEPPEGYYLAFSGGKDSVVIYELAKRAGVKFDAHYAQGGIDPPELVYFIKENYPDVVCDRPEMSVWAGVMIHGMPRRQARWCCELIKEKNGSGRRVLTGIRWQESARRAKRAMFEVCQTDETKYFLHPIIDWTVKDVWEFIRWENTPYCLLYDEGFRRLGCVLCPMASAKETQFELKRFPKLAEAWHRACIRYWNRHTRGTARWKTAEDMWQWWLSRKGEPKVNNAQCFMLDN